MYGSGCLNKHLFLLLLATQALADELIVGKICPVTTENNALGILAFSQPWYHDGGGRAHYQARDDATGIGVEIHFFPNDTGALAGSNLARCDRYRLLQIRQSNALPLSSQAQWQLDIPANLQQPFYDQPPLEHGYGTHQTPIDNRDKPWSNRPMRASNVAIYDTPYVSDRYGTNGRDIVVSFETCVICQRAQSFDRLLSCGTWGFTREYVDINVWAEPELHQMQCLAKPSGQFEATLNDSPLMDYEYWLDWR